MLNDDCSNTLDVVLVHGQAKLPEGKSLEAAGLDLFAAERTVIPARGRGTVCTGLCVRVPKGTYGRIAPRSGLATKYGIQVGAGVIDGDYRGEIEVVLFNHSEVDFEVKRHARIAQLLCEKVVRPRIRQCSSLAMTERGTNGFGSTGD